MLSNPTRHQSRLPTPPSLHVPSSRDGLLMCHSLLKARTSCKRAKPTCRFHCYLQCFRHFMCRIYRWRRRSRRLQVHDCCKCRNPRYLRCFPCLQYRNPRYLRCFIYIQCPKPNEVHGLVRLRTEHPCPQPNDVHGLVHFQNTASMPKT